MVTLLKFMVSISGVLLLVGASFWIKWHVTIGACDQVTLIQPDSSFYAYELGAECIGCGDCVYVCPTGTIYLGPDRKPVLLKVKIPYPEVDAMIRRGD